MTFQEWWEKEYVKLGPYINNHTAQYMAAKLAWDAAYKIGFTDGKRASMKIIDRTFDEYLAK